MRFFGKYFQQKYFLKQHAKAFLAIKISPRRNNEMNAASVDMKYSLGFSPSKYKQQKKNIYC